MFQSFTGSSRLGGVRCSIATLRHSGTSGRHCCVAPPLPAGPVVDSIYFATFFGGSDATWGPTADMYTLFKNVRVYRAGERARQELWVVADGRAGGGGGGRRAGRRAGGVAAKAGLRMGGSNGA